MVREWFGKEIICHKNGSDRGSIGAAIGVPMPPRRQKKGKKINKITDTHL